MSLPIVYTKECELECKFFSSSLVQPQKSASSQPELSNSEDGGRFKSYCIGEEARGIVGTINLPALVS